MERDVVNPEKQQHRRAAAAEEAVICVLIKHPDLASKAEEELPPDNMLTEFDRRVYRRILEIENSGSEFDLMLFGRRFHTGRDRCRDSHHDRFCRKGQSRKGAA